MRQKKKKYIMLLLITTLITVNYQAAELPNEQTVQFVDPNLNSCIADTIGDSDGIITIGDMHSLTSLDCEGYEISSINGLEYAMHLKYLNLRNNNITDISPIADLVNLKTLDLSDNRISDIGSMKNLIALENLYLNNNQISNLSVLSNLPNIYHLELTDNNIQDITALSSLVNVHYLYLSNNQISDVKPIAGLNYVTTLDLSSNQITDLSQLANYSSNTAIYANNQNINYDEIVVESDQSLKYEVVDINGQKHILESSLLKPGENSIQLEWDFSTSQPKTVFNGVINQKAYYDKSAHLSGKEYCKVDEEHVYSNEELIELFNVSSNSGEEISVNATAVDYTTPGVYPVVFTDESGNRLESSLEIVDVLPQINSEVTEVYIPINSSIEYIAAFGISATEVSNGDLTNQVEYNTSYVNTAKEGSYNVDFSVADEEGNIASSTMIVNVVKDTFTVDGNGEAKVYVQKVDEDGNGLGGYEYTIYDDKGNIVDVIVTDENGHGESEGLKNGNYTIVLTGKPSDSNSDSSSDINENVASNNDGNDKLDSNNQQTHQLFDKDESEASESVAKSPQQTSSSPIPSAASAPPMKASAPTTNAEVASNPVGSTTSMELLSVTEDTEYSEYQSTNENNDTIQFRVLLENGTVASGIKFNIIDENGAIVQSVVSDENGVITVEPLPEGNYQLQLSSNSGDYVLENEVNIIIDSNDELAEIPSVITLKENKTNYVVIAGVGLLGIMFLVKVIFKL